MMLEISHVHLHLRDLRLFNSRHSDRALLDKRFALRRVFVSNSSFKCLDLDMARTNHLLPLLNHNER
jgi:hypothetical protein